MIGTSLLLSAVTLVVGLGLALAASRLPSVAHQILALGLAALALPLTSVLVGGVIMLESAKDVGVLAIIVAASLSAVFGAWLIARRVLAPLRELGGAAHRLATGDLAARVHEQGPRDLRRLQRSFNQMAGELELVDDTRTQLLTWAGHDLRTPVASLRAMIEASQDGVVDATHYLDTMHERVMVLSSLVDDFFEAARIEVEDVGAAIVPTNPVQMAEECIHAVRLQAERTGVRIVFRQQGRIPPLMCAEQKIKRVIGNLLSNAVRHTPEAGTVTVVVECAGPEFTLSVADTGPGLSAQALQRMFDHFWCDDPARSADRAGLGLAIARGLVSAHGGRIWAANRPAGGAIVSFALPVSPAASTATAEPYRAARMRRTASVITSGEVA